MQSLRLESFDEDECIFYVKSEGMHLSFIV